MRKAHWLLFLTHLLLCGCGIVVPPLAAEVPLEPPLRPNIIYLSLERYEGDSLSGLPVMQRLQGESIVFRQAFTTSSLCCPELASLLRGQYAHNHVADAVSILGSHTKFRAQGHEDDTIARWLSEGGYRTGFVGSYLPGYRPQHDPMPEGWTSWYALGETPEDRPFFLREGAKLHKYRGEPLEILQSHSLRFIETAQEQPFFLLLAPPPGADAHALEGLLETLLRRIDGLERPTYLLYRASDKRVSIRQATEPAALAWGAAQEETIRMTLAVRPPWGGTARTLEHLVLNIDLAPTFAELAGVEVPAFVDGRSLLPLFAAEPLAETPWRQAFLVLHAAEGGGSYQTLRTTEYRLVAAADATAYLLYSLQDPPDEAERVVEGEPELTFFLALTLERLSGCRGQSCRDAEDGQLSLENLLSLQHFSPAPLRGSEE